MSSFVCSDCRKLSAHAKDHILGYSTIKEDWDIETGLPILRVQHYICCRHCNTAVVSGSSYTYRIESDDDQTT